MNMSNDGQDEQWDNEQPTTGSEVRSADDEGWTPWKPSTSGPTRGQKPRSVPRDLSQFRGVKRLGRADVPADLVAHTKSRAYRVNQYYQLEDSNAWKKWSAIKKRNGGRDKWLFYGCPSAMIEDVLTEGRLLPYGEFYARVLGPEAIYLYDRASTAARVALKFGMESQGFLVSCRLVTGRVFRAGKSNPQATKPPRGYDTVMVPKGTDLGSGRLGSDLLVTYEDTWALMRYITQIERGK